MIPCDVTISRTRLYKRRQLKGRMSSECEEELWSFISSASWKAGELSAIEGVVTVIISELLSVSFANLYKSYCSFYLCFVFSFLNKPSFSITLLVGLFPSYTNREIFVTV
ncbi:hypothetical protein AVEN_137566-1 [Araneus ventricosus]|uniref:Uncharacterized protein n=1 Tax=Araneus ventricosus TaxID=182803 RepID=A0A4Y2WY06_ARAVE|nr:hypothetical protein AVEN_137566-1 [Araneus ventricosus]